MVSSRGLHLTTARQEPSSVVQMIGKYFSHMSTRRGSVESCDERDAGSPGENLPISRGPVKRGASVRFGAVIESQSVLENTGRMFLMKSMRLLVQLREGGGASGYSAPRQ